MVSCLHPLFTYTNVGYGKDFIEYQAAWVPKWKGFLFLSAILEGWILLSGSEQDAAE